MIPIRLQIPAIADYIDITRLCLYGIAARMGFSFEEIEDMKVAVAEACNNAILHGNSAASDNMIDITFELEDRLLTIKIHNNGPSFDYAEVSDKASPLHGLGISELPIGGLGIYLMQALMDEVTVNTGSGTQVIMKKYVPLSEN